MTKEFGVNPTFNDPEFLLGLVSHVDATAVLGALVDEYGEVVDLRYLEANDGACQFLGKTRDELLTGSFLGHFPQHRETGVYQAFADVLSSGEPLVWNDRELASAVRPTGTRFDLRGVRIRDMLVLSWRDNTARAAAAAALAESEAKLRVLAENSSDAVLLTDLGVTIQWASTSSHSTFGWSPSELVGRQVFELIHPEDLDRNGPLVAQARAGHHVTMDARVRTRFGDYRWVSSRVTPIVDADGTVTSFIGGWRDVHDERLAQVALAEANQRLNDVIDHSSDAVMVGDNSGVITWASNSIRRLTGWNVETVIGEHFVRFVHPDDVELVRSVQTKLRGGLPVTFEARMRTPLGDHRWISFQARPQYNDVGVITGRVIGLRDVHREREARDQLARSEERLRAAMQSAPIGMAVVDGEHHVLAVNPALCRLVGQWESWMLARRITDVIDPLDHDLFARMCARLLAGEEASTSEQMRLVHRSGQSVKVEHVLAAVRGPRSEGMGFVSQFLEVAAEVGDDMSGRGGVRVQRGVDRCYGRRQ